MMLFRPGELWPRVRQTTSDALASGHLLPIQTTSRIVPDAGFDFLIRVVASLAQTARSAPAGSTANPFLPYDPQLFVADISPTHVALLNKFMVVDHHLLIVTRDFQRQEDPLQAADFEALCRCLAEYDSVAFYNSGKLAGASQPHRHLQMIPLPLDDRLPRLPVEAKLPLDQAATGRVLHCPALPFPHRWWKFSGEVAASVERFSAECHRAYRSLVAAVGWSDVSRETPYNLQVTRQWMMLVPRRAERFAGISLNAMAFLGALLVRDEAQFGALVASGPLAALAATAGDQARG